MTGMLIEAKPPGYTRFGKFEVSQYGSDGVVDLTKNGKVRYHGHISKVETRNGGFQAVMAAIEGLGNGGTVAGSPRECYEGCGTTVVKDRRYRQGHDAKLKGLIVTFCRDLRRDMSNAPKRLERWLYAETQLRLANPVGIRQMMRPEHAQDLLDHGYITK